MDLGRNERVRYGEKADRNLELLLLFSVDIVNRFVVVDSKLSAIRVLEMMLALRFPAFFGIRRPENFRIVIVGSISP